MTCMILLFLLLTRSFATGTRCACSIPQSCPNGSQALVPNATSISQCTSLPGYFGNVTSGFQPCPAGMFCPGGSIPPFPCQNCTQNVTLCPPNTIGIYPSCTVCPPNTFSNQGDTSCQCLPGLFNTSIDCLPCPNNTYCTRGYQIRCPPNSTTTQGRQTDISGCICNPPLVMNSSQLCGIPATSTVSNLIPLITYGAAGVGGVGLIAGGITLTITLLHSVPAAAVAVPFTTAIAGPMPDIPDVPDFLKGVKIE